jgi:hypothetical protein
MYMLPGLSVNPRERSTREVLAHKILKFEGSFGEIVSTRIFPLSK